MTTEETRLLPALLCNIASRVMWLRRAVEEDEDLKRVAGKLRRFTTSLPFEMELLSGKMAEVQKVVDEITKESPSATYGRAPALDTLDLVSELRRILSGPGGGVEAAQRIEQHIHEVLVSHTEGENPTLQFVKREEHHE